MNYSHYLFFAGHLDEFAFLRFTHDVRAIIDLSPEEALLCGDNDGPVVINDRMLIVGSRMNASPFSRLRISLDKGVPTRRYPLTVIKTDRMPYDVTIGACLLAFKHHFPAASITSDGNLQDWKPAMGLYGFTTEREVPKLDLQHPIPNV